MAKLIKNGRIVWRAREFVLVFGNRLLAAAKAAVGEAEMIVGKAVIGMLPDNDEMASDRGWIIFHPKVIIAQRIANVLVRDDLVSGDIVRSPPNSRPQHCQANQQREKKPKRAVGTESHKADHPRPYRHPEP